MKIEIKQFDSVEEALYFMNSEESIKPTLKYIESVHKQCTEGLTDGNKQIYHDWHSGKYRPTAEEQLHSAKVNPDLYGAIMQSISMGLG